MAHRRDGAEPAFAHVAGYTALGAARALLVASLVALPVWMTTAIPVEMVVLGGLFVAALFGAVAGMAVGCATLPVDEEVEAAATAAVVALPATEPTAAADSRAA